MIFGPTEFLSVYLFSRIRTRIWCGIDPYYRCSFLADYNRETHIICKCNWFCKWNLFHLSAKFSFFSVNMFSRWWLSHVGPRNLPCPTLGKIAVCTHTFSSLWYFWYHCHIPTYCQYNLYVSLTTEAQGFRSSIESDVGVVWLFVPDTKGGEDLLVFETQWDMAAANVACKEHGNKLWEEIYLHNANE